MDEYSDIIKSKVLFKGEKKKKKLKSSKTNKTDDVSSKDNSRTDDAIKNGGWWKVNKHEHIKSLLVIEFLPNTYMKAVDDGSISLGQPHPPGDAPDDEEIFSVIRSSNNQIALKSGFGRYISVDSSKTLVGLSEAIGEKELFLPVFQDDEAAISTCYDTFLSLDEEDEQWQIVARSTTVGPDEKIKFRVNYDPLTIKCQDEEVGLNHVVQHYDFGGESKKLKKARRDGELHEALLDDRTKKKSDKYCK